ncbi:hypothetical protein AADEFJLK_02687 [Methylovulum psychrotolerans]|uniref:Uncharacterized protein n=1 Tax=Methylovulum psychrotolerans TaxID=1704499 RepID=A0A2S5CK98_9GAMM|nr:hypothetical protein AADEFJLK_02687 [Methylovulum psychrotolerans]
MGGFDSGLLCVVGHPDDGFLRALDPAEGGRFFRRRRAVPPQCGQVIPPAQRNGRMVG